MLDIAIFTQHPNSYAPNRLAKEADFKGLSFKIFNYCKIDLNKLPNAKYVILREPDSSRNLYKLRDDVLKFYTNQNSKILNSKSYSKWSVLDKKLQHQEFKKAVIPSLALIKPTDAKFPYIVKAKLGSHGSQVYKIKNNKDIEKVLQKYKVEDLIIQEFQTSGFDLRVIVLNNKVLGIMKRTPKKGNFLSNYSQGGIVTNYIDIRNKDIEKIALKTAKHFKLDYCGVDLMKDNNGNWIVLEVNRACQFSGFEKSTKVNVAKSVIEYLTS